MQKFYTVYKTTNKINNKIYIGSHETFDLNDKYIGSGKAFKHAVKKYGKENFTKEILFIFDNKQEMLEKEKELVNKNFIISNENYNLIEGGVLNTAGYVSATNNGSNFLISLLEFENDSNITGITKGFTNVKIDSGTYKQISNIEFDNGDYVGTTKGKTTVKDADNNIYHISIDDPRYKTILFPICTDYKIVKDSDNNYFRIPKDVETEMINPFSGQKHSEETLSKMCGHDRQVGEKNSQFGTFWLSNDYENVKVKSDIERQNYLDKGYKSGINISLTKRKTLDKEIIQKIIKLREEGFSANKIGRILEISKTTVLRYLI